MALISDGKPVVPGPTISAAEGTLRAEAREALLTKIKECADRIDANRSDPLRTLAEAYALVVGTKS
jgi:hypothetical protein